MFLDANQKTEYIDCTIMEPAKDDPKCKEWKTNNSLVQN